MNMNIYTKDIGKSIYGRDRACKGVITGIVERWCGGCQSTRHVYSVKWNNGRRTYPCPAGCRCNEVGIIEIV